MTKDYYIDYKYNPETDTLYIYDRILVSDFLTLRTIYKHIMVIDRRKKRW